MKLRHSVFWPPFLLVTGALCLNLYDPATFLRVMNAMNNWILSNFSGAFAGVGVLALFTSALVWISPLGRTTIGGRGAKPVLDFWSWVAISICTNTGAGILFWSMAEPLYHLGKPPVSLGLTPGSHAAGSFALSTLFLHWSFTPSAIFTVAGLVFALCFHNLKLPFSLSSSLRPLVGERLYQRISVPIDSLSLFTLVLGMAASLDTGILSIAGGVEHLGGFRSAPFLWNLVGSVIIIAFILSAVTGVEKGIKYLSHFNSWLFVGIAVWAIFMGFPQAVLGWTVTALEELVRTFPAKSLFLGFQGIDPWPQQWTVFYWAVWLAWTPVSAAFLGRIGAGYTVRQFILVNLLIPAVFAIFWTGLFGGTTLHLELAKHAGLSELLAQRGPEGMVYAVLALLPGGVAIIPFFLGLVFISYVTAADSNCVTMAGLSTSGISPETPEPPMAIKTLWGLVVGILGLVMLGHSGVEGIKALSYLGGLPALFFEIAACLSLLRLAWQPERFRLLEKKPAKPVLGILDPEPTLG